MLKSLLRKASARAPTPRVPSDLRIYAIGDIHGCDAEFAALLEKIEADHAARTPKRQVLILLGDLVDRGPDSAAVVERTRQLAVSRRDVRTLAGNHEELLLLSCAGDDRALRLFAHNGGRETALSYSIPPEVYDAAGFAELPQLLTRAVPDAHLDFLSRMEEQIVIGDYVFVHAGIRPGVPLAQQRGQDLRWIRNRFLKFNGAHEKFVIHGHTITDKPDSRSNRLGIDTGAFATGRLTAVALEDERRWFLQTGQPLI